MNRLLSLFRANLERHQRFQNTQHPFIVLLAADILLIACRKLSLPTTPPTETLSSDHPTIVVVVFQYTPFPLRTLSRVVRAFHPSLLCFGGVV